MRRVACGIGEKGVGDRQWEAAVAINAIYSNRIAGPELARGRFGLGGLVSWFLRLILLLALEIWGERANCLP